jgi:hypothetical protein
MTTAAMYEAQVRRMAEAARTELARRPGAQLQFAFPRGVGLIATAAQARQIGAFMVNAEGEHVLAAMSRVCDHDPTILMVRIALELACQVKA